MLSNCKLQNGTASQNGTVTKRYIVIKWSMLQNSMLQNDSVTKWYTYIMVCYSTLQLQSTGLHQPMDWLGVKPNLTIPGCGQSQSTELHHPMDWLGWCVVLFLVTDHIQG
jgi:hypothetical protein